MADGGRQYTSWAVQLAARAINMRLLLSMWDCVSDSVYKCTCMRGDNVAWALDVLVRVLSLFYNSVTSLV